MCESEEWMSGQQRFHVTCPELTADPRHLVPIHARGNAQRIPFEMRAYFVRHSSLDFQKLFYRGGRSLLSQMDARQAWP